MGARLPAIDTFPALRAWQRKALVEYLRRRSEDFMAVATPGAGKTTFALRIAAELLADGTVEAVTVVAPTEHLKTQWALAAARVGIQLDSAFRNADVHSSADFHGAVVTYAQVGMAPQVHRRRTMTRRTLVILDEIHHAGDSRTWGDGVKAAFEPAVRRLMLTGTPFRSDDNPIPFVTYERGGDGLPRSRADSIYGYADALRDGVVRPVIFLAYSGETRWRTSAGDELAARLGEPMTQDLVAQAWRTALDPAGDWMPQVLRAADARLQVLRAGGMTDAGGLVIATDQQAARAYARLLERITGEKAVVVLSDDVGASARIAAFARLGAALDGRGPDGLRGRRHPAPGRRRLRHQRLDPALLRPGDRPLRPGPPAGGDRQRLPAQRAAPARAGQRDGGRARPRARRAEEAGRARRRPAGAGPAQREGQR